MTSLARAARTAATLGAITALTLGPAVLAGPADAAVRGRVAISPGTADPEYATRLSLRGSGFQAVKGGFGGVYVMFGWVDTKWRPSEGGVSGQDFVYVQDSEDRDNHGYQRFVSFEDGGTLSAANGGIVHADGTWATTLVVPGATFPAQGRDGAVRQIDCRTVRCGVITFGAHGVVSPQNETFTPVTFAGPTATHRPLPVRTRPKPATTKSATKAPSSRRPATSATSRPSTGGIVIGAPAPTSSPAPSVPPVPSVRTGGAEPGLRPAASTASSGSTGWWIGGLAGAAALTALAGGALWRRRSGPGGPA